MSTTKEYQSGFSLAGVMVIIGVVIIVAVSGILIFTHRSKNKVSDLTPSPTINTKANSDLTTQTQQQVQQYLAIKEWGIQLPLSNTISDAYYVISVGSTGSDGLPNKSFVGLASLDASGCQAAGNNQGKDTAIGAILRLSPSETDEVTGKSMTEEYPNGVTIGEYYYAYQVLQNNNCKAAASSIQSANSAFSSAVKGITTTTNKAD